MALIDMDFANGGGSGKVDYGQFTMPSNNGSQYTVSVPCGFQPKQIMICCNAVSDYKEGFALSLNTEDSTKNGGGFRNGEWYSVNTTFNPANIITPTTTGFDVTLPNVTGINYLYSKSANDIAKG